MTTPKKTSGGFFVEKASRRHFANLTRQEFTRAVRALSVRYVERRSQLPTKSPLDSAGKRAAFGLFYASMHFLTVEAAVAEVGAAATPLRHLFDLGCGTGVCSAAWALALPEPHPSIDGFDLHPWALDEARWNWHTLGLQGRAVRSDAVAALERLLVKRTPLSDTGIVAGWAVNELDEAARVRLLAAAITAVERSASLLLIEPLARGVSPWWDDWVSALRPHGAIAGDYKFDVEIPSLLAELADSAGLSAGPLGARVLWVRSAR